jgi:hypothetical protein
MGQEYKEKLFPLHTENLWAKSSPLCDPKAKVAMTLTCTKDFFWKRPKDGIFEVK